ncbi:MAG: dermonecrotic toxin domain-containing protein [Stenotrophomonas sp.]|uniref:dermonecrotic toxin domain-containing protein n=1 Tax=Stenotrophomonas sp. TaxID=69392 RepID=UPI003D6CBBCD
MDNALKPAPARVLQLSHVPQSELDALARALAEGPVDGPFLMALQGRFAHTALAAPMAEGLVNDGLATLLPPGLDSAERDAWQQTVASLLICSRAGWEVACLPLRASLSAEVAWSSRTLQAIRDALYRPFDLPSAMWLALLSEQRARGVADCRVIARTLHAPGTDADPVAAEEWLRTALRGVAPLLHDPAAVTQEVARAAREDGLVDPRHVLAELFDRVDADHRPAVSDTQRGHVLYALAELECPGRNGQGSPLLAVAGSDGSRLGHRLLDIASRAALDPAATQQQAGGRAAVVLATLEAATHWLGWLGARTAGAQPTRPDATLTPAGTGPQAQAQRAATASAAVPVRDDAWRDAPLPVAASAGRCSDGALLGVAAGALVSGVSLMRLGWSWAFPNGPEGDGARDVESHATTDALVTLLDHVMDVQGRDTVWNDIRSRVQAADDATGSDDLVAEVEALLLANGVADRLLAARDANASVAPHAAADRHIRARRNAHDLNPVAAPAARVKQEVADEARLADVSRRLIEAAKQNQPAVNVPGAIHFQPGDGLPDAEASGMISFWGNSLDAPLDAREAMVEALNELADSEVVLAQALAGLPHLDDHIAAMLSATFNATLGERVDPRQIYRNTFQRSEVWERWESSHPRPPSLREQPGNRPRARPGQRVRSGLTSSYTLVEAAVLPPERDSDRTALYFRSGQSSYFPNQECQRPTLAQFNAAIAGRRFIEEFAHLHGRYVAGANDTGRDHDRSLFCRGTTMRLIGASILMIAGGRLSPAGAWLVSTMLLHPAQFDDRAPENGRALKLPGKVLHAYSLQATPAGGPAQPLHGVLLLADVIEGGGATVVVSTSRTPAVEEFESMDEALAQLEVELPRRLERWVAMQHHHHWQQNRTAAVSTAAPLRGDFMERLFQQELDLRQQQLQHLLRGPAAVARRDFNALDQQMSRQPTAVALPILKAAAQVAAATPVHWLADVGAGNGTGAALRNIDFDGVRALYDLNASRSLLEREYPLLPRFVEKALDDAVLARHGVAFDSSRYSIVTFSGGTRSNEARSGWVHNAAQRTGAQSLVECALSKAEGFPEGDGMLESCGLYLAAEQEVYDQKTEATEIGPDQFLTIARELDLQGTYLAALADFWTQQRREVEHAVRGSYLFSAWQQYGDGSLSDRGLQLALMAGGDTVNATGGHGDDPAMGPGIRAGWLEVYGIASTILQIQDTQGPETILYYPNEQNRFYEFAHPQEMVTWLRGQTATDAGCAWIEPAFDLADLQDGWFYSGVQSVLGLAHGEQFPVEGTSRPIEGNRLVSALVTRLQARTESDARVLMTSNWQSFRHHWLARMQRFNVVAGLASVVLPPLLPVVAVGTVAELGLGAEQAIDGRTEAERSAGARSVAGAAIGLAPLAVSRLVNLAAADGARVEWTAQVVIDDAAVDPLRGMAERYALPGRIDGVRPAENGVYHYAGKQYIRQAEHTYEVFFDDAAHTWRLRQPAAGLHYEQPVRLNAEGAWEVNPDVGLRGGGRAPEVSRSVSIESSYRGALNAHLAKVREGATDAATADFRWGMVNWRRVRLSNGEMSVADLKRQFLEGGLDMVQKGAMSEIIARLEALQRNGWYARLSFSIDKLVHRAGGGFMPVSQGLLFEDLPVGGAGVCTGLSRIMAVALGEDAQVQLVRNLRAAISRPGSTLATTVREMALDAQGAALPRYALSASERVDAAELAQLLGGVGESSQFVLSGASHSMACAVKVASNGRRTYSLYDPNFGLVEFTSFAEFERWLPAYFELRPVTQIPGSAATRPLSLGDLYGAYPVSERGEVQFGLRQVGTDVLRQQAVQRRWNQLLYRISSP